ncbi:CarboxypepD_reg-like domain-containing protein [Saccharicrinis carchari]|uniref:CarboxypepD_reg-like domain-containing protein n=1 Tax=Saccharicrinis carchari TaxID=1168039 RepID=A0A521AUI0_SACCC|nr:carboxypeptidase-like regulatory domain-containing protein [Saccharicrinis carchari]SMO38469.1 CarboxypepD_reg-like domain-containing protein [Saccharicrinis carchari]
MKTSSIPVATLFFVLGLMLCPSLYAQNFTVNGTVVDAETGLAVEFANIGVEGTYLGTASDANGNFEIALSRALFDNKVSISAVGYQTKTYQVSKWNGKHSVIIQLAPVNYGISEVNIEAQSKVGYGILRNASSLITQNYLNEPYSYRCYMRTNTKQGGEIVKDEALFIMTDNKGYGERSFSDAFENIHYRIKENNPHKPTLLLEEGMTSIDNLIAQDILRNPGNILSVEAINEFDVQVQGQDVLGNDSVWIIAYTCKNPTIQNAGDPDLITYKGTIWIAFDNYQVLKNSFTAIRKGAFRHGNSFYKVQQNADTLTYKVETTYKSNKGRYVLNSIAYKQVHAIDKNKSVYLKVVQVEAPETSITDRQYFNGEDKNPVFWNTFKRPE